MRLRSGAYFDFENPHPDDFTLSDIAGALSKLCRFGGQCNRFYSIAEHCCHCYDFAKVPGRHSHFLRAVLMHDAAEAFCNDLVKDLKELIPQYKEIEKRIERCIDEKYQTSFRYAHTMIKRIDSAMLVCEKKQLFTDDGVLWKDEAIVEQVNITLQCWPPHIAEYEFLLRAKQCLLNP